MTRKYAYWLDTGKYAMLQKVFSILLGMLAFMLLARIFVPADFGVWGLFIIISSIIETCRNALVRNGYIRFINSRPGDTQPAIEAAAMLTNGIFTVVLMLLLVLSGELFEQLFRAPGLSVMLWYYAAGLLLLAPFSWFENFFYSRMDFRAIFWMYFVRNASFLGLILFFYLAGYSVSKNLAVSVYSLVLLPGILIAIYYFRFHPSVRVNLNWALLKEFLNYGKYVLGNNFFSLIFVSTDSFMTSRYVSSVALSYYSTGARLLNFADIPSQVLGDIMFPRAARLVASGTDEEVRRIYERTVAASLTLIIPIIALVLLFTDTIILVLAGPQYLEARHVLVILIFYALFLPFLKQFGNIMDARGLPHYNFWLMLVMAIVNIALNYILISYFGYRGAAIGTLTSYVIVFIITQYVLYKALGVTIARILYNIPVLYYDYFLLIKGFLRKRHKFLN
ncbi:MAG: flippase [Chitinophagaceae bacterium]|nr:flippase [Chitinophagaceae bacterium]